MAIRKTHGSIVAPLKKMKTALEAHVLNHGKEIEAQNVIIAKAEEAKGVSNEEIKASNNTIEKLADIIG